MVQLERDEAVAIARLQAGSEDFKYFLRFLGRLTEDYNRQLVGQQEGCILRLQGRTHAMVGLIDHIGKARATAERFDAPRE